MADTIGKLSIQLGADSQQMHNALNKAQSHIQGFITNIGGTGVIMSGAFGAVVGIGKALLGTLDSLIERNLEIRRTADALNINVETFQGMGRAAHRAGLDMQQLTVALQHGARTMSEANAAAGSARDAFANLGLDFRELKNQSIDQQFTAIGAAIMQLQSPADRVAASMHIFGRSGAQLLPLLSSGADGIAKATAECKRLGITLSEIDLANLKNLRKEINQVKEKIEVGLSKAILAIVDIGKALYDMFAPAIDGISSLYDGIGDVREFTIIAFREIIGVMGYFADAINMTAGVFLTYFVLPVIGGFSIVLEGATKLIEGMSKLPFIGHLFTGISETLRGFSDGVLEMAERVRAGGEAALNTQFGDNRAATDKFFDDILAKNKAAKDALKNNPATPEVDQAALNDLRKFEEELRKQVATFGMTAEAIRRADLVERGLTESQLANVDSLIKQHEAQEAMIKLLDEGKKLTEEMKSPFEAFTSTMENLAMLLDEGVISLETYSRAAVKAMEQVANAAANDIKLPGIQLAGSAEAANTIARSGVQAEQGDRQQQIQKILADQRETQQRQLAIAQDTLRAIQNAEGLGVS